MRIIKIPVKFHLINNQIVFDEEILLQDGDMLIQDGIFIEGIGTEITNVYIQRIDWQGNPPKWEIRVDGKLIE